MCLAACLTACLAVCVMPRAARADPPAGAAEIQGFSPAGATAEARLEQRFDADISAAICARGWSRCPPSRIMSARFTTGERRIRTEEIPRMGLGRFHRNIHGVVPTPRELAVELVAPTHFAARLTEPAVAGDSTSAKTKDECGLQYLRRRWRRDRGTGLC